MTSRSSIRAGGGWRVAVALLLALAFAAAAATPPAHAASAAFCPTSGFLSLGAGNGCTGTVLVGLVKVSFFQNPGTGSHCAVGKETRDPDSAQVIVAVCGAGSGSNAEVTATAAVPQAGFPRGRNDTASYASNYWGSYEW